MKWISVEKKLPKDGQGVLGWWGELNNSQEPNCFAVACYEHGRWFDPEDDEDDFRPPAYWMPLPAIPKSPQ